MTSHSDSTNSLFFNYEKENFDFNFLFDTEKEEEEEKKSTLTSNKICREQYETMEIVEDERAVSENDLSSKLFRKMKDAIDFISEDSKNKGGGLGYKIFSREINQTSVRCFVAYPSMASYYKEMHSKWKSTKFHDLNDHELLYAHQNYSAITGIFFDVDLKFPEIKIPKETKFNALRDKMIKKTRILITSIVSVFYPKQKISSSKPISKDSNCESLVISEASDFVDRTCISLHGIVKFKDTLFYSFKDVQAVLVDALSKCMEEFGLSFLRIPVLDDNGVEYDEKELSQDPETSLAWSKQTDKPGWLDLGIYSSKRSFRCLYQTKRSSRNRPLLPLISSLAEFNECRKYPIHGNYSESKNSDKITLEIFKNSLIVLPIKWMRTSLTKRKPLYYYKVSSAISPDDKIRSGEEFLNKILDSDSSREWEEEVEGSGPFLELWAKFKALRLNFATFTKDNTYDSEAISNFQSSPAEKLKFALAWLMGESIVKEVATQEERLTSELAKMILDNNNMKEKTTSFLRNNHISVSSNGSIESNSLEQAVSCPTFSKAFIEIQPDGFYMRNMDPSKADSIPPEFCFKKVFWIFQSNNHYCSIKEFFHTNNHVYYVVDLLKKEWYQKCFSSECIKKNPYLEKRRSSTRTYEDDADVSSETQIEFGSENPYGKSVRGAGNTLPLDHPILHATLQEYLKSLIARIESREKEAQN
jgi:hypothetical protein